MLFSFFFTLRAAGLKSSLSEFLTLLDALSKHAASDPRWATVHAAVSDHDGHVSGLRPLSRRGPRGDWQPD